MAFLAPALPMISAAAAIGGTAISAMGMIAQGNQQRAAAAYNARVDQIQAQNAQQQAAAQAAQTAQETRRKMGEAAAAFGAAGVNMEGSPLAVMSDLATQGELTKRLTLYRGQVDAQTYGQRSVLDAATGQAAQTGSLIKAGGTLLTGLGGAAKTMQPLFASGAGTPLMSQSAGQA